MVITPKAVISIWIGLLCQITWAQQQWHHQLLQEGFLGASNAENTGAYVNRAGQPAYNLNFQGSNNVDVYRNLENLTAWLGPQRVADCLGINDKGQVAYAAFTSGPHFTIYTDHHDWSSSVLNPNVIYQYFRGGIDASGQPLWKVSESSSGKLSLHLFLGSQPISDSILTGTVSITSQHVNRNGDVAWGASANETNGISQVFFNQTAYSASIVGPNVAASPIGLSDAGDIYWTARINGIDHIFINSFDFTNSVYGADGIDHKCLTRGVSSDGALLWYTGNGLTSNPLNGLFVNNRNISYEAFGTQTLQQREALQVANNGHAYWDAQLPNWTHAHLMVDTRDVSFEALGDNVIPDAYRSGIDDSGHLMWTVRDGYLGSKNRVYVDDFALSDDALGTNAGKFNSQGIQIGPNGQVMWVAWDPNHLDNRLYLSTAVPEPTLAAGLLPLLLLWRRRRTLSQS
jgi:hypothetical protein